jgi:hypothetical protein
LISLAQVSLRAEKPTIVIILADDMGYGVPRCSNPQSKIVTPHKDRLVREGMMFTDEAGAVINAQAGKKSDARPPLMLHLAYPAPHTPWLPAAEFSGKNRTGILRATGAAVA